MNTKIIKRIFYKYGLSLSVAFCVSSCSLNEFNPISVPEESLVRNFTGWKAYQSNIYTGLWGSLIGMPYGVVSEAGTDLWTFPFNNQNNNFRDVIAYREFTTNSGVVRNTWDFAWGPIKDCNKTIELSTQLTDADANAADIKVLVAEAQMLRGYYYSVLVAQFGDLPLVLTDDPTKNLSPKRTGVPEIYNQIVSDLRSAFQNLPVTPYENNPQRVNKKAAFGLLARVYAQGAGEGLSEGGKSYWLRAKEVADSLINNRAAYGATMYDDFAQVFAAANNRNNAEALFTA
jgi:starch-binding outer membrane protein, SusD/RagB family